MRNFIAGVLALILFAVAIGAIIWLIVTPRLDWGAGNPPGIIEQNWRRMFLAAGFVTMRGSAPIPYRPPRKDLKAAQTEYEAHCAVCHGLDGSGRNQLEAEFYPPVAKLTGGAQKLSDAEIYFIVTEGISYTAMPSFGKNHSPDDIWRAVLWVRHLAHLTSQEQAAIATQMKVKTSQHESTMSH